MTYSSPRSPLGCACFAFIFFYGHPNVNTGAAWLQARNENLAADETQPLLHAQQPESLPKPRVPWIETHPVIGNLQRNRPLACHECDLGGSRAAMLYDVAQGLLGHAVETERHFFGERVLLFVIGKFDFDAVPSRNLLAVAPDGGYQPDVLQDGGV